jgi:hypothetical protein
MKPCLRLLAPLLLALPTVANAAATYVDRTAFNAAVSGVVNNDLESLPLGVTSTVFGVETIASGTFPGGAQVVDYGEGFGQALGGAGSAGNFDSLIFTFTAPIYAFAFDDLDLTGDASEFANIRVTYQGGSVDLFNVTETDNDFTTAGFFGVSSTTALQSVEVWSSNTAGGPIDRANLVDNLAISRIASGGVPEPASWSLMILGFGLAGAVMRRRVAGAREALSPS